MNKVKKINKKASSYHQTHRKIKVGTMLDERVVQYLKERSVRERRPINSLIEEAVRKSERESSFNKEIRLHAMQQFLSRPFNISLEDLKAIMEEDYYDQ